MLSSRDGAKFPAGYVLDPSDPRAPTSEQWSVMTAEERARVVESLPTSLPLELHPPPEGDLHRKTKQGALSALDDFFRRAGRRIYLSSELAVFYPGERTFIPDLLAVLDVEPHDRMRWTVDLEGKGIDFVLEVLVAGRPSKDLELNVESPSGITKRVVMPGSASRSTSSSTEGSLASTLTGWALEESFSASFLKRATMPPRCWGWT